MTEERYNEICNMSEDDEAFKSLSLEEYNEYRRRRYLELTDPDAAIGELLENIRRARDGSLPVWKTGFAKFDELLDGGFLGGNLILLGAISSLGKTTFALQIAENLALSGNDVLVFSLEMSKKELLAKTVSRNTYRIVEKQGVLSYFDEKDRLTMGDVLRGRIGEDQIDATKPYQKRDLFEAALAETRKLGDHLYVIRDNSIDIFKVEDFINAHIVATGNKPFVILDYLQILKHDDKLRGDKRVLTDEDVNGLKDLAVRLDLPIMVISSFNRNNYFEPVSPGSFKESGTIEYTSDTLIGMQYTGMQYQKHWYKKKGAKKAKQVYESQQDHNTRVRELIETMDENGALGLSLPIDVVLLKNRGVSKGKVLFEFCPKYNVFTEKEDQTDEKYKWNHDADETEDGSLLDESGEEISPSVVSSGNGVTIGKTVK